MYEPHTAPLLSPAQFAIRLARHGLVGATIISFSLLIGMFGYVYIAGLTWIDAFMNASMLLGGMGPVNEMPTTGAKLFAGVFALYSGIVFIAVASILIAPVAHRVLHRLKVDK